MYKRNAGASLVEINERMSELLDKHLKCDVQNEDLKIKILGFTQALIKCGI